MFGTPPIIYNSIVSTLEPADPYFFDGGTDSWLDTSWAPTGLDMTFVVEAKIMEANGTYTTIAGVSGSSTELIIGRDDSNRLFFQVYDGTNIDNVSYTWTNDFDYHVFGFRYNSSEGPSIWVDGTEVASSTEQAFTGWSGRSLQIGKRGVNDSVFVGEMKIFKVWDEALSDSDMGTIGGDINALGSDVDLNWQKTGATWTDEYGNYDATDEGGIRLTIPSVTMTTTASISAWNLITWASPHAMTWSTTGAVSLGPTVVTNDAPTWDFSSNTGNADIFVTVTSHTFKGHTSIDLWATAGASAIKTLDISECYALTNLNLRYASLANDTDLTLPAALNSLTDFTVRGNNQLSGFDTSTDIVAPNLELLWSDVTYMKIDISNFPLLDDVRWYDSSASDPYTRQAKDAVAIQLAAGSVSNGNLDMDQASRPLTPRSKGAYDTLIARGWTIDYSRPDGIIFETTSTSSTYAPTGSQNVATSTLKWHVTGPGMVDAGLEYDSNNPTMNLSTNTGTATITVESADITDLTTFWLWYSNLVTIDLEDATGITDLNLRGNNATFTPTTIDISALTALEWFHADVMGLTSLDIINNTSIDELRIHSNSLPAAEQDEILTLLDGSGVEDGTLYIDTQSGSITPTEDSYGAYLRLKEKGWFIDISHTKDRDPKTFFVVEHSFRETSTNVRITGVYMRSDGLQLYHVTDYFEAIHSYNMTAPFALRTMSTTNSFDVTSDLGTGTSFQGIRFNPAGTKMFIACLGLDGIQQYTLTTPWDITGTMTFDGEFNSAQTVNELTVEFNEDGTTMWIGMYNNNTVYEYDLTTAWDVTGTVTYVDEYDIGGTPAGAQHMHYFSWVNEGKNAFMRFPEDTGSRHLNYYSISTAYDLSSTVVRESERDFGTIVWSAMNAFHFVDNEGIGLFGDYQRDIVQTTRSADDDIVINDLGYCYRFPGVDDHYAMGINNALMKDYNSVSFAIRFRMGGTPADDEYKALTGSTAHNFMRFDARVTVGGQEQLYYQASSGGGMASNGTITDHVLHDGRWHTIGATINAATGQMVIYMDGVSKGGVTEAYDGWDQVNDTDLDYEVFQIGDRFRGGAGFSGDISHIVYYDSLLTSGEMINITSDIGNRPTAAPFIDLGDVRGKYLWYDLSGNERHAAAAGPLLAPENRIDFRGEELLEGHGFLATSGQATLAGDGIADILTDTAYIYPFKTTTLQTLRAYDWVKIDYTIQNYVSGEIRSAIDATTSDTGTTNSANGNYSDILFVDLDDDREIIWANGATAVTNMEVTNVSINVLGNTNYTERDAAHPYDPSDTVGTNWTTSNLTHTADTGTFVVGTSSLKFAASASSVDAYGQILFDTVSGEEYRVTIVQKQNATSESRLYVRNNADTGYIGTHSVITYSATFATHTHTFTADGAQAGVRLFATVSGQGSPVSGDALWIDSLIVENIEREPDALTVKKELFPAHHPCSVVESAKNLEGPEFSINRSGTVVVSETTPYSGAYCVKMTCASQNYVDYTVTLTGMESGEDYTIVFWAKVTSYSEQRLTQQTAGGWLTNQNTAISATSWTKYTVSHTANSSTLVWNFEATVATVNSGDELWLDYISITKD